MSPDLDPSTMSREDPKIKIKFYKGNFYYFGAKVANSETNVLSELFTKEWE